ncbi:hypothetical protein C1646_699346 [Rhizophagus diaphanus]|nr:hypothetical protein C1646_699346 [Rhizophagus diaphanus] [Rhizophagus sp. MUCL 43196]
MKCTNLVNQLLAAWRSVQKEGTMLDVLRMVYGPHSVLTESNHSKIISRIWASISM